MKFTLGANDTQILIKLTIFDILQYVKAICL